MDGGDTLAGVALLHDVSLAAIFALVAKADLVAGNKVTADVVNNTTVNGGQLVAVGVNVTPMAKNDDAQ